MKNDGKLKGKDLINIGIYAAIYCVIMTAVAMLGFIPIMMPMLCVLVPLLGGIPYMLFITKVQKFGMITIYSTSVGLFLWIGILAIYFWHSFRLNCRFYCKNREVQKHYKINTECRNFQHGDFRKFCSAFYQCK